MLTTVSEAGHRLQGVFGVLQQLQAADAALDLRRSTSMPPFCRNLYEAARGSVSQQTAVIM